LALTDAGRTRLTASHDAVLSVEESMLHGLTEHARDQLCESLARCAENLEAS
jgi:DNA-binding MarR family transcriptional regulator